MQQLCGQIQERELRIQKIKPRLHDRLSKSFPTNVYSRTMSTALNDNYVSQIEWLPENIYGIIFNVTPCQSTHPASMKPEIFRFKINVQIKSHNYLPPRLKKMNSLLNYIYNNIPQIPASHVSKKFTQIEGGYL